MRPVFLIPLLLSAGLAACGGERPDGDQADSRPAGSYEIDSDTGETLARFEDEQGVVTTMRSGEQVPLVLPDGFTLYPNAEVTNTTRVERPDFVLLTTDLESADDPADIASFYRQQASEAGFAVEVELDSASSTTVAARSSRGDTLSLSATREMDLTRAQLSITTRQR